MSLMLKTANIKEHRKTQIKPFIELNLPKYAVLCGGAIRSLIDFKPVNDYDVYVISNSNEDLQFKIQELNETLKNKGFKRVFTCPKGELFTHCLGSIKIQVINVGHKIYTEVFQILDSFDFNLCCMAYHEENFIFFKKAIRDVKKKKLTINRITYPSSTINRLYKYRKSGFNVHETCKEIVRRIIENADSGIEMEVDIVYVD